MSSAAEQAGGNKTGALTAAVAGVLVAGGLCAVFFGVWQKLRARPSAYTYDLTALRRTDPDLIVCREVGGGFPTGFRHSRAVTVAPDGSIHVAGDRAVRRFDATGKRLGEMPVGGRPRALAVDDDGKLFLAMANHVEVYTPDGKRAANWPRRPPKAVLTDVALADENVYVADAGNRLVLRYDKAGRLVNTIGQKDPDRDVPGFVVPSPYFELAVAPDGLLRVTDPGRHRITTLAPSGERGESWGRTSSAADAFSGCCNPISFALLPGAAGADGYGRFGGFVTCEKGLTRVKLFDAAGRFAGVVAGPESFTRHDELTAGRSAFGERTALDVAVDAAGRIFVLDPATNEVRIFERTGQQPPTTGKTP